MIVRRASAEDWQQLRELRLRALAESPDVFLTTLDGGAGAHGLGVAGVGREHGGLRRRGVHRHGRRLRPGGRDPDADRMWVTPERRGTGLAEALARAVIEWARGLGAPRIVLWVVIGNVAAERFYGRIGFAPTGVELEMRNGRDRELALDL